MYHYIKNKKRLCQIIVLGVACAIALSTVAWYCFGRQTVSYAALVNQPLSGLLPRNVPVISDKPHHLPVLRGIALDPQNVMQAHLYFDSMDERTIAEKDIHRLIKYFLGFLAIPQEQLWVNLSPYEQDRIAGNGLEHLDIGKDLLLQDYYLKQLTAALTSPKTPQGKKFWRQVHAAAKKIAKTTNVPIDTFYKVWIVPDIAEVYSYTSAISGNKKTKEQKNKKTTGQLANRLTGQQNKTTAFIKIARLRVMLESDYLAYQKTEKQKNIKTEKRISEICDLQSAISDQAKQIFRSELLPIIQQQVNNSRDFAPLRQMYYALILANYCKQQSSNHRLLRYCYDQQKVQPITLAQDNVKQLVYDSYVDSFNCPVSVRSLSRVAGKQQTHRMYVSGGENLAKASMKVSGRQGHDPREISTGKVQEIELQFVSGATSTKKQDPLLERMQKGDIAAIIQYLDGNFLEQSLADQLQLAVTCAEGIKVAIHNIDVAAQADRVRAFDDGIKLYQLITERQKQFDWHNVDAWNRDIKRIVTAILIDIDEEEAKKISAIIKSRTESLDELFLDNFISIEQGEKKTIDGYLKDDFIIPPLSDVQQLLFEAICRKGVSIVIKQARAVPGPMSVDARRKKLSEVIDLYQWSETFKRKFSLEDVAQWRNDIKAIAVAVLVYNEDWGGMPEIIEAKTNIFDSDVGCLKAVYPGQQKRFIKVTSDLECWEREKQAVETLEKKFDKSGQKQRVYPQLFAAKLVNDICTDEIQTTDNNEKAVKAMIDPDAQDVGILVYDLIEARLLSEWLQQEKLTEKQALVVFNNILSAMEFMHSAGVIHQDIKSENIFVLPTGKVFVFDFDVAGAQGEKREPDLGTWGYNRPSAGQDERVMPVLDIYSLGIVGIEMIILNSSLCDLCPQIKQVYQDAGGHWPFNDDGYQELYPECSVSQRASPSLEEWNRTEKVIKAYREYGEDERGTINKHQRQGLGILLHEMIQKMIQKQWGMRTQVSEVQAELLEIFPELRQLSEGDFEAFGALSLETEASQAKTNKMGRPDKVQPKAEQQNQGGINLQFFPQQPRPSAATSEPFPPTSVTLFRNNTCSITFYPKKFTGLDYTIISRQTIKTK